jgi:hypothetical protein
MCVLTAEDPEPDARPAGMFVCGCALPTLGDSSPTRYHANRTTKAHTPPVEKHTGDPDPIPP